MELSEIYLRALFFIKYQRTIHLFISANEMKKNTILIVDDEAPIRETISAYAEREGYTVFVSDNGEDALLAFAARKPDIVILDWMLPGISGPEIVKKIRETSAVPILMVSARDSESDVVLGLDLGADDYITKPFGPREMMARVNALLRRKLQDETVQDEIEYIQHLEVEISKSIVRKEGREVMLTPNEFRIFAMLFQKKGTVLSREQIMENALGYQDYLTDRTLDTHIKNLRKKIELSPTQPKIILTIRERGFKMSE